MDKNVKIPRDVLLDLEKHLKQEKIEVERNIKELTAQDPFIDTDRLNDNAASDTEASEQNNHERYQAMLKELKLKLKDIEAAQERIEKGTYGYCLTCGKLIDTDRLGVVPTATYCVEHNASK
jgi:RNA polymerase-binding transcription factor DksA